MRNRTALLILLLVLGLILFAPGCKKKTPQDEPAQPPAPPPVEEPVEKPVEVEPPKSFETEKPEVKVMEPTIAELNRSGVLKTVYFGYDRYDLTDDTRRQIQANAGWLNTNSKYKVVVQGHCDERGTIEYNLALGERRARAVRDYMVDLGVSASRVRIVSYGEEKPAVSGHTESAWSKNRRAQFVIE